MFGLIVQGIGYGFAAGTSPGPLLSFLINTTLAQGWRRGMMVTLAPLVTDIPIILVMVFLLGQLPDTALRVIQLIGGAYVLWLAWLSWRSLRAGDVIGASRGAPPTMTPGQTLRYAAGMNTLSPGPYIFWGVVTGPILREALTVSLLDAAAFVASFYITFLGLMAVWVVMFDRLRRVDPRVTRGLLLLTIMVLVVLGLQLILEGLSSTV
ncbi:MAG: LysE family translocator [Chloroflexota bacterium]